MTSILEIRSRDPGILNEGRRSVLGMCAKKGSQSDHARCFPSHGRAAVHSTSFSPRPERAPKRSTALHASNHFFGSVQKPNTAPEGNLEGFQLITRLCSLLGLQQQDVFTLLPSLVAAASPIESARDILGLHLSCAHQGMMCNRHP